MMGGSNGPAIIGAASGRRLVPRILGPAAFALLACSRPSPTAREPAPEPAGGLTQLDVEMHAILGAVRTIHAALLRSDLDGARDQAARLARLEVPGELGAWERPFRLMREQSTRLATAPSAGEARRRATELATYCADCHMVKARAASFPALPAPETDGTLRGAMERHRWAADTMWLGIIGPSPTLWRSGLQAIGDLPVTTEHAATPDARLEMERLRRRLDQFGPSADRDLEGQGDRAARLAAILEVCAACHAVARR